MLTGHNIKDKNSNVLVIIWTYLTERFFHRFFRIVRQVGWAYIYHAINLWLIETTKFFELFSL